MFFVKRGFLILIIFINLTYWLFAQDSLRVSEIILEGNDITKDKIILRELLFQQDQYILRTEINNLIEKSEQNLLNTSLFNFVTISSQEKNTRELTFTINLQERWYIWPYPVLEHADRNFSSYLNNQQWSRFDYGIFVLINNFRGRKEILKLKSIFGFNNNYSAMYYKPYIDKNQKIGLGFEINYVRNKEVSFQISNNELEYLRVDNKYLRNKVDFTSFYTYRPQIYLQHLIAIRFDGISINDSIFDLNRKYFYNENNQIKFFSAVYDFDLDKRDSKIYPLQGFRIASKLIKQGLGIFENQGPFFIKSAIEGNLQMTKKIYFNVGVLTKYNFNKVNSFYFSQALGYDNYLRGMEYYVSNGTNYYISKSNLKFQIIPQTKFDFSFIKSKKFSKAHYALYTNIFFDTGYVNSNPDMSTSLSNEFLYSGGIGIDFVTYYDKVLRIEYSINKFGEHGLFFHLGAPIIE